jgi:hypothetical protein
VFGCSAVSGAMIAAYYDNNGYPDMYTGPTNGGVMPLTDTSWPSWYSSVPDSHDPYPNNPLIASHFGVDGRTTRGSIDDYWRTSDESYVVDDPYITGGWTQHTWSDAIGDYMKTSQSAYSNVDGSTAFYNWISSSDPLTCTDMVNQGIDDEDGTYGRKLFYEARGYSVGDCYNQKTDNNGGGFTLSDFQEEIDAGHPVLLNLAGHSIVGYGYSGSTIYIRDTWDNNMSNVYTMTWGGSYDGMALQSVSVVRLPLAAPPSPPTGVSASDGTFSDKVRISWSPSAGADDYKVFRNTTNSSAGAAELVSGHSATSYDDFSAAPGLTYYYWVKACNYAGCSDYSAYDSGWRTSVAVESQIFLPLILNGAGTPGSVLINGDFEQGHVGWTEYSTYGWDIVMEATSSPTPAHGGSWLAWLGGDYDDNSYVSQSITIPAGMPYLHYWYWIASEDYCGYDYFWIKFGSTTLLTNDLCETNSTGGWVEGVLNLAAYAGSTNTLKFEATTDSSLNSNLFLDDISFSGLAAAYAGVITPEGVNQDLINRIR